MLQLSNVSKDYAGGIKALSQVDLSIPRGMFGLLGPNGAGKSTLMRTVATLQSPDTGSIRFGDIDVLRDKTALRRVLGYLPQEFGAYPRTSAETMLRHFAALKGLHGNAQRPPSIAARPHEPLGCAQAQRRHVLRGNEAALWNCPGPAR